MCWTQNNYVKRFTDPDGVLGKTGTALLLPISKFAGVQKIPNHKERMEVSHLLPDACVPSSSPCPSACALHSDCSACQSCTHGG